MKDGIEILVGMSGEPVCENDFDRSGRRREAVRTDYDKGRGQVKKDETSEGMDRKWSNKAGDEGVKRSESTKRKMGNSISELSKRFSGSQISTSIPSSNSNSREIGSPGSLRSPTFSPNTSTSKFTSNSRPGSSSGPPLSWRNNLRSTSPEKSESTSPSKSTSTSDLPASTSLTRSGSFNSSKNSFSSPPRSYSKARPLTTDYTLINEKEKLNSRMRSKEDGDEFGGRSVSPEKKEEGSSWRERLAAKERAFAASEKEMGKSTSASTTTNGFPIPLNSRKLDPMQKKSSTPQPSASHQASDDEIKCSVCKKGPFEAPDASSINQLQEVRIVALSGGLNLHEKCFTCSICYLIIDPMKSFVRLSEPSNSSEVPSFGHPRCVPNPIQRPNEKNLGSGLSSNSGGLSAPISATNTGGSVGSNNSFNHATHQRKPLMNPEKWDGIDRTPPVTVYGALPLPPSESSKVFGERKSVDLGRREKPDLSRGTSNDGSNGGLTRSRSIPPSRYPRPISPSKLGTSTSNFSNLISTPPVPSTSYSSMSNSNSASNINLSGRRFQATSGAAPPTRSTMNVRRRPLIGTESEELKTKNPAAGMFSKVNPAEGLTQARLGGMSVCSGCGAKLSSLESVLGPRGSVWHRNCLKCGGEGEKKEVGWRSGLKKEEKVCGKKLDSGAKVNEEGEVRCRECFDRGRGRG